MTGVGVVAVVCCVVGIGDVVVVGDVVADGIVVVVGVVCDDVDVDGGVMCACITTHTHVRFLIQLCMAK